MQSSKSGWTKTTLSRTTTGADTSIMEWTTLIDRQVGKIRAIVMKVCSYVVRPSFQYNDK